ncbi:hypothetical protein FSP39_023477, partial [Pinctada imbricata]
ILQQIQKLVAPPVSDEVLRRQRRREREYRRGGRTVNHDCCDSCKEGGDLLCCDWCPAAFHLQCHDPPLEEDDVPPGEWKCHKCKVSPPQPEKDDDASSTQSGSSTGTTFPRGTKSRPVPRPPTPPSPSPSPLPDVLVEDPLLQNLSPLQKLARAAAVMNPVQFELPKDISCTTFLPGSSKRKWWGRERNPNKKIVTEMENHMVPLPAKLCFICSKSCRVGPLIQCDYCPLLYHMDCLDPPLTSLPTNRWMCPNHPEHAVDQMLLKSLSLTERVKLWDRFNQRVNQNTVKVNFISKVHRQNPLFRIKVQHPMRKTIAVPDAIKMHYHHPPPMLPRATRVSWQGDKAGSQTTPEEQEEWLTAVVALQTNIAKYLAQREIDRLEGDGKQQSDKMETEPTRHEKPTASVQPVVQSSDNSVVFGDKITDHELSQDLLGNGPVELSKSGAVSLLTTSQNSLNGDVEMDDFNRTTKPDSSRSGSDSVEGTMRINRVSSLDKASSLSSSGNKNFVISAVNKVNNAVVTKVLGQTQGGKILTNNLSSKNLGGSTATSILSPRGLSVAKGSINKPVVAGTPNNAKVISLSTNSSGMKVQSSNIPSPGSSNHGNKTSAAATNSNTIASLNASLQQCLQSSGDKELSKLDERLVQILAWQRLQQLLPTKEAAPTSPSTKAGEITTTKDACEVRARAVLCPLTSKGQPIPMSYRTLNIGTGADMDVCLSDFGHCNFTSPRHAFIFYDETTKHYELLNYSEHGTTVDNVLYSCDFSDKPACTPQPTPVVAAVRNIIKTKQEEKLQEEEEKLMMSSHANSMKKSCNCKTSSSSLIGGSGAGWEGTALLHHGSYIKLGCLQFVFSIVDHATASLGPEKKRESMSLLKSTLRSTELDLLK